MYGIGNFLGPPQKPYNPHGNTYNSGWRDHPNLSYVQYPRPYPIYQPYQPPKSSLEELVERLEQSEEKFQDRTKFNSQEIDKKISRLEQVVGRLESHGKLPSQTETNPRENVSAMTLRSGTVIEQQSQEKHDTKKTISAIEASDTNSQEEGDATTQERSLTPEPIESPYVMQPPFPSIFIKQAEEKEILDVKINIPLLKVIRKMPRYAPFLKELCANKRKLPGHENVNLGEHVSTVLTRRFPSKLKDQGMFATPRKIHRISLKEVLSWTNGKKWRKLQ
ncbi:hypothetical protein GQ457_02G036260 [Hibiscus cannabinus]